MESFPDFLDSLWKFLGLGGLTPVQRDVASWMDNRAMPRRGVQAFRGLGKTWAVCGYVLYRLDQDPNLKVFLVSSIEKQTKKSSAFIKTLLETWPRVAHLAPQDSQRNSVLEFDIAGASPDPQPSVAMAPILGSYTGTRSDLIIADDIEVPTNSCTQAKRENLLDRFRELPAAILKPKGEVLVLGTPQTEETIYRAMEEMGIRFRIWPLLVPDEAQAEAYGGRLAPRIQALLDRRPETIGSSVEPSRFTPEDIERRRLEYGASGFKLQFMLDPSLSDEERYPLKLRNLVVLPGHIEGEAPEKVTWASSPELAVPDLPNLGFHGDRYFRPMYSALTWLPFTSSILCIDPAGRGRDETAYVVLKYLNGYIYVTAWGGLQGDQEDIHLRLARLAKDHKVNQIYVESNYGDGMWTQLFKPVLQRIHPCPIEDFKVSGQKEHRIIDTLEPLLGRHRLVFPQEVLLADWAGTSRYPEKSKHQYSGLYQLTHITREKGALIHDDRLDALASGCARLVADMDHDEELSIQSRQEEELRAYVNEWVEGAAGPSEDLWWDVSA